MKKFCLIAISVLLLSGKVFSADYYSVGVDAFKKGCYVSATSNLEHAIIINPKNVNARYYLAQVYILQNRIDDAENQYKRIIILAPESDAGILSQKGLSLIVQSHKSKGTNTSIDKYARYQDNYLDYIVADSGGIKKWQNSPLAVYVQTSNYKPSVEKAFMQWQAKTNKVVSFNFVNNPAQAKIVVDFKNKLESTSTDEGFFAGFTKPYYSGNYLAKAEIHILTVNPQTNQAFDDTFVYSTVLHEIGHSLGFIGHSPNANDVMAATSLDPKITLTQRDTNTMILFYKMDNKTYLARQKGTTDVKLQQALDYVKNTPAKSIGWSNLGDVYIGKKMYTDAIKSYKQAVSIEPDRANSYSSLGVAYRLSGDKQNAYLNIKKACDLDKTNTVYLNQLAAISAESGHKDVARTYIQSFLKTNPQEISDENIKTLLNY